MTLGGSGMQTADSSMYSTVLAVQHHQMPALCFACSANGLCQCSSLEHLANPWHGDVDYANDFQSDGVKYPPLSFVAAHTASFATAGPWGTNAPLFRTVSRANMVCTTVGFSAATSTCSPASVAPPHKGTRIGKYGAAPCILRCHDSNTPSSLHHPQLIFEHADLRNESVRAANMCDRDKNRKETV
eukprot:m.589103 g.589103  ORF g.589103 m.589103 type:complete len:186 (-) comp22369_c0_seq5:2487-3044(-)